MDMAESQSGLVARALAEDIMTGRLPPGAFLSEARLAARFGVSRTPVREAIRSLAADGLAIVRPRQRAIVRGRTAAEILDEFEAMAALEGACAGLAARRRSPAQLARMEESQARCRALSGPETDPDGYYRANVIFHETIYEAAGNDYLRAETLRLRDRLQFLRITQGRVPGRLTGSAAEHDSVLDAIRVHDEDAAEKRMRGHLIVQWESLHTILRNADSSGFVHVRDINRRAAMAPAD